MKSYLNAALCAGLMLTLPSIQADSTKDEWVAFAKEKMADTYLFANRVCVEDFLVVWPILGAAAGYDIGSMINLFLTVNAGRLVINLAAQQFDQMSQTRSSIATGVAWWLGYSLSKSMFKSVAARAA